VKLEITPEPSAAERKAIEKALALVLAARPRVTSAWREAGVHQNTEEERGHPPRFGAVAASPPAQAGARPRSRPGATRA
jgi:hypothetical protein